MFDKQVHEQGKFFEMERHELLNSGLKKKNGFLC